MRRMNMEDYLKKLAIEILKNCEGGLTKVKFAKIIYFVHKGLVSQGVAKTSDLRFIRMPLGPVPVGFMGLSNDPIFKVSQVANAGLVYNSEQYSLNQFISCSADSRFSDLVKKLSIQLNNLTTSELVGKSHNEPSWINNTNGVEYFVSDYDLAIPLPSSSRSISDSEDNQKLQEKLVEGMIDDIVSGSTSLEYPEPDKNQ